METGDPVVVNGYYGRITDQKGGTCVVMTPGRTTITSGLLWVEPATIEQKKILMRFERQARHMGVAPYRALFSLDQLAEWNS